jgi:hypothetical protein
MAITYNSDYTQSSLRNKATKPETADKANYWIPISDSILSKSKKLISQLEDIKKQKKPDETYFKKLLTEFCTSLKKVDSKINLEYSKGINDLVQKSDSILIPLLKSNKEIIIADIQNEISLLTNKMIVFCNEQVGILDGDMFRVFEGIVGQNTTILQQGEKLIITAGVGSFSKAVNPSIKIKQIPVKIDENGCAIFQMKAPKKPGKYRIPVEIKYFDQYAGEEVSNILYVEYTVLTPCN